MEGDAQEVYSEAIERAIHVALEAHRGQLRKGSETPYVAHPVHVALLLARFGADVEVIQAGLLHDVVEDAQHWTLSRVEEEFGTRVRSIVAELTEDKRRPWEERKESAIDHAARMSPEAAHVKACDKLHNLESLLAQLLSDTDRQRLWGRFNGGRDATLSMDRRLVRALVERVPPRLAAALKTAQGAVERAALGGDPQEPSGS